MAIIPAEEKVFMVSNSTNTTYSGSAALKAMQQWYTMQDVLDSVSAGGAPTLQEVVNAGNFSENAIVIDIASAGGAGPAISGIGGEETGVLGQSTDSVGVYGSSDANTGVYGGSTDGYGGYFTSSDGPGGVYAYSEIGNGITAQTSEGYGVYGYSGESAGVYGQSNNGFGVYGSSNDNYGGYFTSGSETGVAGVSSDGNGVYGSSGGGYGVYGSSSDGYGGFFSSAAEYSVVAAQSAAKPGGGSWSVFSDSRIKENITPYTKGLAEILLVNTVTYDYNGLAGTTKGAKFTGIIAQEIKEIFPETVNTYKAKLNEEDEEKTDLYDFNSSDLTFALINAVKELNEKIKTLEAK
jgi:hypothetical protein